MNDFLRETVKHYPEFDPSLVRVILVHYGDVVLPELGERLGRYAQEKLRSRGVELRLGARVSGYDDWVVKLSAGEPIPANTLVWAELAPNRFSDQPPRPTARFTMVPQNQSQAPSRKFQVKE